MRIGANRPRMASPPARKTNTRLRVLSQRERDLDEDQDWNRLAETHAGFEAPLPQRSHGFFVETKLLIEGMDDANVADVAVGHDDGFQLDQALDSGAHGLTGVVRLRLVDEDW